MGPAVPQRDARRVVRHGGDLLPGWGQSQREGTPNLFLSPPFYSLPTSPLAVQTPLEVQDAVVPAQARAGLPDCKAEVFFYFGADFNIHPPPGAECGSFRGGPASAAVKGRARNLHEQRRGCRDPQGKSFIGTTRGAPCGIHTGRDASPGKDVPKYLQNPSVGAKRRPRDPEVLSVFPRAPFQR